MSLLDNIEYAISSWQKYHPERFISKRNILREDDYNYILIRHLKSNPDDTEYEFLNSHINRAQDALKELEEINEELLIKAIKKEFPNSELEIEYIDHELKRWRSKILDWKKEYETVVYQLELRKLRLPKPLKETKSLRFDGDIINLSERFKIADRLIGLNKLILDLNMSQESKHKFLGLLLGCNPSNARNIINGKYPSKDRNDRIEKFITSLQD